MKLYIPSQTCLNAPTMATLFNPKATERKRQGSAIPRHFQCTSELRAGKISLLNRRQLVGLGMASLSIVEGSKPALGFEIPPPGYRRYNDKLDGYVFVYPEDWQKITSAGAEFFVRDVFDLEANAFVEVSSPSSSNFKSVTDLGTPEDAAKFLESQYLLEFMSTRIGVRRFSKIVSFKERTNKSGDLFYDIELNITSFADTNQFGITPEERVEVKEFDRHLFTTLGTANGRLYQLRVQSAEKRANSPEVRAAIETMYASFKPYTINA